MTARRIVAVVAALTTAGLLTVGCSSGTSHPAAAARSSSTTERRTTTTPVPAAGSGATSTTQAATGAADPSTTAAPAGGSASKADFVAAANSICKTTNAKTKAVGDTLPSNPTAADQASAIDKGADIIQAAIAQMQRLNQPTGDRTELVRFYQRSQQLIVLSHTLADAFRADDPPRVSSIETQANTLDDDLTHAADAYGLTACGSGSGA